MDFKPAAGLFVGGVTMTICGWILGAAGGYFATVAVARSKENMANVLLIVAVLGGLLTLIGFCVLIVSAHRALAKIDSLPVQQRSGHLEDWSARQH